MRGIARHAERETTMETMTTMETEPKFDEKDRDAAAKLYAGGGWNAVYQTFPDMKAPVEAYRAYLSAAHKLLDGRGLLKRAECPPNELERAGNSLVLSITMLASHRYGYSARPGKNAKKVSASSKTPAAPREKDHGPYSVARAYENCCEIFGKVPPDDVLAVFLKVKNVTLIGIAGCREKLSPRWDFEAMEDGWWKATRKPAVPENIRLLFEQGEKMRSDAEKLIKNLSELYPSLMSGNGNGNGKH